MNNHSANSYEVTERRKMQKVKLGKICEITMGQSPESQYYNVLAQGLPFFQGNADFGERHPFVRVWCTNPKKTSDVGAILMSVRAPIGALNLVNVKCAIGRGLVSLKPNSKCMLKYLLYALKSKVEVLKSMGTGSTFKAISKPIVEELEIPLPPIEEQRAIAEKLDKVSQLVDKRKEQLQQLDQLVKSQFIDMFGDPVIDEDNGDTLGDYFNIVSGGTPDTKNMDYWQNGTIPWIGSSACQNCVIKTVNQKFITQMGLHHSSSKILGAGTVLVALVGATIGKTALLKCETAINQNIAGIKVLENKQFTPQYVFYAMQFLYKKFMEIGGDKFKMANLTFIRGLPFAKQPIVLQNKFAEFVENVEKLKEKVNNSLTHLNLLKQSLMQQYFG